MIHGLAVRLGRDGINGASRPVPVTYSSNRDPSAIFPKDGYGRVVTIATPGIAGIPRNAGPK